MLADWWREIIGGTGIAAVLGFLGTRVLRLEREKADRASISELVAEVKEQAKEARESRRELHQKLDSTIGAINSVDVRLARVEGRLNGRA